MPGGTKTSERVSRRKKADVDLRQAARKLTHAALETLRSITLSGHSEQARIAAASAILAFGHGNPVTLLVADPATLEQFFGKRPATNA